MIRCLRVICGKESKFRGSLEDSGDGGGCAMMAAGDDDIIIQSLTRQSGSSGPRVLEHTNDKTNIRNCTFRFR